MKGKREMVWAVVISAGLILGCDGDGAPCQAACEKLSEYRIFEEFKNGPKGVEECVEQCKEELVEHEEETVRAINCTMDNNSRDEIIDCLLKR